VSINIVTPALTGYAAVSYDADVTIADEVRALRKLLGENTATFGARFLKSGRTIETWEQGTRAPDPFVLAAIRALAAKTGKKKARLGR